MDYYSQELKDKMYQYLFKEGNTQTLNKINEDRDEVKYLYFNQTKREIEQATNFLPDDIDFNARIYCIENEVYEYPKCIVCGKRINWNKTHKNFPKHCSKSCVNNNPTIRKRMDKSKKDNNSYIKSDSEEKAFQYLSELFGDVKRQYKDIVRYPFNCDFYIPHLDFFIEININWTHGGQPFDNQNALHIAKLSEWERKAEVSDFFRNAIKVWTEYDIKKFRYAKEYNLNFVAIYNWVDKNDFLWQVTKGLKSTKNVIYLNSNYKLEEISKEIQNINNKQGDLVSAPIYNKAVVTFQPHFFNKEQELYRDVDIKEKLLSNREYYLNKNRENLTDREILNGFKKSGIYYGYSHFSPLWLKYFIEKYDVKSIYDPCGGWGHRLLGAWNIDYYYNDTDKNTKEGVEYIWKYFKGNNKSTKRFFNRDAASFTPSNYYDAVFTCPPYYNKEKYYGGKDSINTYPDYKDWLNKWWKRLVEKSLAHSRKYFAFIISKEFKDDLEYICNQFPLELIEESIVGNKNQKSHFQSTKNNFDYLIVYKRTKPISTSTNLIQCQICKRNMKSLKGLKKHLTMSHPEVDRKEYYNNYLKPKEEPIQCPYCGKEKAFFNRGMFYWNTCGDKECVGKLNSEKVREHHNNYSKEEWSAILSKRKKTNLQKYGTEWAIQDEKVKEKRKQTNLEKFGVENNSQTQEWKDKVVGKKRPNYKNNNF